jgi:hypothetical protein
MERRNLMEQFIGEPDPQKEGINTEDSGYDEVVFNVKGGKLSIVVPVETPDDRVFDVGRIIHILLVLENDETVVIHAREGEAG